MKNKIKWLAPAGAAMGLVGVLFLAAGCGSSSSTPSNPSGSSSGSCANITQDGTGTCTLLTGSLYSTVQQSTCQGAGGTWSSSTCSTSNVVGQCALGAGSTVSQTTYYYSSNFSDVTARSNCQGQSGTYTGG